MECAYSRQTSSKQEEYINEQSNQERDAGHQRRAVMEKPVSAHPFHLSLVKCMLNFKLCA